MRYHVGDFTFSDGNHDGITAECVHCGARAYANNDLASRSVAPSKRHKFVRVKAKQLARRLMTHEPGCALQKASAEASRRGKRRWKKYEQRRSLRK